MRRVKPQRSNQHAPETQLNSQDDKAGIPVMQVKRVILYIELLHTPQGQNEALQPIEIMKNQQKS